jgi:hypothetical protein
MRRWGIVVGWLFAAPGLIITASLIVLAVGFWAVPGCMVWAGGDFTFNGQRVTCPSPLLQATLAPVATVAALSIYAFILTVVPVLYSWVWVIARGVRRLGAARA